MEPDSTFCPKCDSRVPDNANYCPACGYRVAGEPEKPGLPAGIMAISAYQFVVSFFYIVFGIVTNSIFNILVYTVVFLLGITLFLGYSIARMLDLIVFPLFFFFSLFVPLLSITNGSIFATNAGSILFFEILIIITAAGSFFYLLTRGVSRYFDGMQELRRAHFEKLIGEE